MERGAEGLVHTPSPEPMSPLLTRAILPSFSGPPRLPGQL